MPVKKTADEPEEFEDLTESEIENAGSSEEELEGLEEEEVEEESLEESFEEAEEDLEEDSGLEELEARGRRGRRRGRPGLQRLLLKRVFRLVKIIVKKLLSNPLTAKKLKIACKRGPRWTCRLICPIVCRALPIWLRFLCRRLCPIVVNRLFRWICQQSRVGIEEVEEFV